MILSIIIPVHNAEKYLERCINSILISLKTANLKDFEIFLVENSSTDHSLSISQNLAKTHPKTIKTYSIPVTHAGAARNFGMAKARGDYLWFIDADDTIAKNAIKEVLNASLTPPDLIMLGATRIYNDGHTDYLSAVTTADKSYKSRYVRYGMGPWQCLMRHEWFKNHDFRFREDLIHEDMELMPALILYTDNFVGIEKPLYNYYQNENSILHKTEFTPDIFDIFPDLESLYNRFESANATEKYHDELEWFFIWNLLIDSAKDFRKFKEGRSGLKKSRELLKTYFPGWYKNPFLRQKPLKLRLYCLKNYYGL